MARRNPMPLSGAIFHSNPRRKNRRGRRRRNRLRGRGYTTRSNRGGRGRRKRRRSSPYKRVVMRLNRRRTRRRGRGRRRRNSYRGVAAVMRNRRRRRRRGRGRRRRNSYRGVAAVMRNRRRRRGPGRRRRNSTYILRNRGGRRRRRGRSRRNRGWRRINGRRRGRGRGRRRRNSTYILRNRRRRGRGRRRRNYGRRYRRNAGWRRLNGRRRGSRRRNGWRRVNRNRGYMRRRNRRGYGRRRRNSTYILRNRRRRGRGRRRRNYGRRYRRNYGGVAVRMNTDAVMVPGAAQASGILYKVPVIGKMVAGPIGGALSGAIGFGGIWLLLNGVGPVPGLAQYLPSQVQGIRHTLGGVGIGLLAGLVPGKVMSKQTKTAFATVAIVAGGAVDMANWLSGQTSLPLLGTWSGAPSWLQGGAPATDGMAAAYAEASEADAMMSGADLDPMEGNAALAGPAAWGQAFPMAKTATRVVDGPYSPHAGQHGHRWGWLIRMIGWDRFQKIAALPANQRVQYLDQLRQHAAAAAQGYGGLMYAGG